MGGGASKSKPVNKTNNSGGENDPVAPKVASTSNKQEPPAETRNVPKNNHNETQVKPTPAPSEERALPTNKDTTETVGKKKETEKTDKKESVNVEPQRIVKPPSPVMKDVKESEELKSKKVEAEATTAVEEKLIDEGPKEQLKFDCALKSACLLVIHFLSCHNKQQNFQYIYFRSFH